MFNKEVTHFSDSVLLELELDYNTSTRKPYWRKETALCRSCSFRFKVRREHSLQV